MTVQLNKPVLNPATQLLATDARMAFFEALSNVGPAVQAATESIRKLAETLENGPRTGMVRVGPGIAGLRTITL